jgi:hypothetical protein
MESSKRLMVFDTTCRGRLVGLSNVWSTGRRLYGALGRLDDSFGATTWEEALRWLADYPGDQPIGEVQFWGHGQWGRANIDGEPLSVASLEARHRHRDLLDAVRDRLAPGALWWFRTCLTFGADSGLRFARELADYFGCRVAGHTFIIAYWQSGLHSLEPGQAPGWSPTEGLRGGTADEPDKGAWSYPWSPNTVSCLSAAVPLGY